jgi:sugar/nucleoside kinase (ribokinase family)
MSEEKKFDLLVAGEINPDLILSGNVVPEFGQVEKLVDNASLTVGSSSAIFACGAARLGLKVAFIGLCGNDVFGRFMLEEMAKREVDVSEVIVRDDQHTGLSVILDQAQGRAILTYSGLISCLKADDIPRDLLRECRHLHVSSYFLQTELQAGLPEVFAEAVRLGLTTSLDTNYDPAEKWEGFDRLLASTHIFFPNEREALSLSGEAALDQAAARISPLVEILVIKLGPKGALGVRGDQIIHADSIPVEVVDTVGAGDSFAAGFIYAYLQGWDLKRSLELGCACGGLSTRRAGGVDGQPDLDEAMKYVSG